MRVKIPLVSCRLVSETIHSLTVFNNVDGTQKERVMKLKRKLTVAAFMICSVFGVTSNASASYPEIHYNKACGNNDLGNPTVGDDCWIYTFVNELGFQATISGDIPPGLHFVELQHPDHDHFYALRGILSSSGVYNFSVQFTDEYGVSNTKTYSLQVNDPIILSDPEEIAAEINVPFSYTFSPSGGEEPYRYNTFGDIPDGLSFNNNTLSGTPNKEGDYKFTVVVGDKNGIVPFNYTIKVFKKTEIFVDDASLAATVNQPFSYTFTATGGKAPYTFQKVTGVFPSGLSLTGDTISGTPTSVNTHQFDLRVTDADGVQATKSFDIEIKKDMRPPVADDFTLSVGSRDAGTWIPFDVRNHITSFGEPVDKINIKGASATGVNFNISGLGGQIFVPISAVGSVQAQYTVSNALSGVESNIATITINLADPSVSIIDVQTSNAVIGQPFQARYNAVGAASPYTYSISGDVPPGLVWSVITNAGGMATYELAGTPTTGGTYNFTLNVADLNGFTASKSFSFDIPMPYQAPKVADLTIPVPRSGNKMDYAEIDVSTLITNFNDQADVLHIKNVSDMGVTVNTNNMTVTAAVPRNGPGVVQIQYSVSNSSKNVESNVGTITLNVAPAVVEGRVIDNTNPVGFGLHHTARFESWAGAAPYHKIVTGDVPPGLFWSEVNNSGNAAAYELSGKPTQFGVFNFSVLIVDDSGISVSIPHTIDISDTMMPRAGTADVDYGQSVSIDLADYIDGHFAGVEISSNAHHGSVSLSGTVVTYTTPDKSSSLISNDHFSYYAVNAVGGRQQANFTINLNPPLAPTARSFSLNVERDKDVEFDLNDYAQAGFFDLTSIFVDNYPASGIITDLGNGRYRYTPETDGAAETIQFSFVAQDTYFSSTPATITIEVAAKKIVSLQGALINGKVGDPISHKIGVNGGVAPFQIVPMLGLPVGLTINGDTFEGIPEKDGVFMVMMGIRDAEGTTGNGIFRFEIAPADAVVDVTLPALLLSGKIGNEFSQKFTADGGSEPYTFAVVNALPDGLALNGYTVSGTPTVEGTFSFQLQATDANGVIGSQTYSITIAPADVLIPAPKADNGSLELEYGQSGSIDLAALTSGNVDTIIIAQQPSKGVVKFDGNTASYTPNDGAVGSDQFTFSASNAGGSVTATVTISIKAPVGEAPVAKNHVVRLQPTEAGVVLLTDGAVSKDPINRVHLMNAVADAEGRTKLFEKELKFLPHKTFAGSAVLSYQLENRWGHSNIATVTFIVAERPDPSKDAEVAALIKAQMDAAIKLDSDQVDNITKRIEEIRSEAPGQRLNSVNWDLGVNSTDVKDDEDNSKDSTSLRGEFRSENPLAFWSTGYVRLGEHDDGKIDFSTTTYGGTAGLDYRFSESFVGGIAVGYGREVAEIGSNSTENEAQAISGAIYGTWHNQSGAFIDGILGYSHLTMDSTRYVTSNGGMAYGSRSGSTVFGSVIGGYRFETTIGLKIEPYAGFRGVTGKLNGFTEYGADWNALAYGDTNIRSLKAVAGLRLEKDFETEDILITPSAKVEYRHELAGGTTTALGYSDLGTMPYSVTTEASETKTVVASVGVRVKPKGSKIAVEGNVQANFNGSSKPSTTYSLKVSGQFCGFGSKEGDCMTRDEKVAYFKVELAKAQKAKNKPRISEVRKLLSKAEADLVDWKKLTKNSKPLPELLYVDTISGKPGKR